MDCRDVLRDLSRHLDHEIQPEVRSRLESHLADCRACSEALAGMRAVDDLVRAASAPPPPPDLAAGIMRAVASARGRGREPRAGFWRALLPAGWPLRFAGAAAALVVAAGGAWVGGNARDLLLRNNAEASTVAAAEEWFPADAFDLAPADSPASQLLALDGEDEVPR